MRMNRKVVAVSFLAALFAAVVGGTAWHATAGPFIQVQQVKWDDGIGNNVANLPSDTTFQTDEADTVRTVAISTGDWDWGAIASAVGGVATGVPAARVMFVSDNATNNGVTDSLYFNIEKNSGRDTLFTYSGTITAAVGNVALPEGTAGAAVNVWTGVLMVDPDTPGANNLWMVPNFRIRLAGDQSGATPKISQLKCYVIYPKRAESQ